MNEIYALGETMKQLLCLFFILAGTVPVFAQDFDFLNPFLSAADYRALRGDTPNATLTVTFKETERVDGEVKSSTELVFDLSENWVRVRRGTATRITDFRLQRSFLMEPEKSTFASLNANWLTAFRVLEFQNRLVRHEAMRNAGINSPNDACDDATELAVDFSLPAMAKTSEIVIKRQVGISVECNGRLVGKAHLSGHGDVPEIFWPALASELPIHPALLNEMKASGAIPQRLESLYWHLGDVDRSWELLSVAASDTAYPLTEAYVNGTPEWLADAVSKPVSDLAYEVVAGTAAGGVPTYEEWDAKLRELLRDGSEAEAALVAMPVAGMFPEIGDSCRENTGEPALCDALQRLSYLGEDPAITALLSPAIGDRNVPIDSFLDAMRASHAAGYANNPVLNVSHGLALLLHGSEAAQGARARGLPDNPTWLIISGIEGYPYYGAYWTDLGDAYMRAWNLPVSMVLYDIAMSVPLPEMQRLNDALQGKRAFVAQIQEDFPYFYLPQ